MEAGCQKIPAVKLMIAAFDSMDVEESDSPVSATFKSTRLINQHTIESLGNVRWTFVYLIDLVR